MWTKCLTIRGRETVHGKRTMKANLSSGWYTLPLADLCDSGSVHYFIACTDKQFSNSRDDVMTSLSVILDIVKHLLCKAEPIYGPS